MPEPTIDASAAIKELGITRPVKFISKSLNGPFGPELTYEIGGTLTIAQAEYPDTVAVDWEAARFAKKQHANPSFSDPAAVIAHELIHIKQFQQFKTLNEADAEYIRANRNGYDDNPFEAEAFKLAPATAPLVQVAA